MILLSKLLLAPSCVVAVSLAGRRWGTAIAGILGGLPVVAGPILLVLALVHGPTFGAIAAAGTLLGLCALATFVVIYGRVSESLGPAASVLCGWGGFLATVALLDQIRPPEAVALAMAGAASLRASPCCPFRAENPPRPAPSPGGTSPRADWQRWPLCSS